MGVKSKPAKKLTTLLQVKNFIDLLSFTIRG